MRAPVSWLRELVAIPADEDGRQIAERLIGAGLEVETVERVGAGIEGPIVVGQVLAIEELTEFKKPIRWCQVDVGASNGGVRGIICGARNFAEGDHVVVALPGTVLPGGFAIAQRQTYGKTSDGMICSARELSLGDDHDGILVLGEAPEVGADAKPILGVGEEILDIAVTPDRGYALSIRGLARELAVAYGVTLADPGLELADLPAPVAGGQPVACASDDERGCALFTLRTISGFNPAASSPAWMRRRLVECGMRPVSLAVDVTNYVMLELGQPLHAFDAAKLQGTVRAGHAPEGARLETLDHVERTLAADDLLILDDRGPIGLAGTMGGLATEIDEHTTSIAVEAAHFAPGDIARMARRHRLSSEASRRFERGVDRVLAPYASARATALLLQLGGGEYLGMTAVEAPYEPIVIALPADEPARVAGMPIDEATVIGLLEAVGCELVRDAAAEADAVPGPAADAGAAGGSPLLRVTVPSWRADLADPADLVEEVLRLVGYDQIPSTLPKAVVGHGLTWVQRLRRRVGSALAARGAVEILNYPFVGEAELQALRLEPGDPRHGAVRLANPLSDEQPLLRASLLPGLVAAARRNLGRGMDDLFLFELGSVVRGSVGPATPRPSVDQRPGPAQWQALNAMLPAQGTSLAAVLVGDAEPRSWQRAERPFEWSDALAAAQLVAQALGVRLDVAQGADPLFHPGRCARLSIGDAVVGVAGELHPRALEQLGLPPRGCAMELDFDLLAIAAVPARPAPAVWAQPVAKEDLALVVREDIPAAAVEEAIWQGAGPLLESVRLFDVYRGPQVPEGSRSLAFALRFRAPDRTLDAAEIARARQGAVDHAERELGAALRGA